MAKIVQKTEKIHHVLQGGIKIACTRDGYVAEIENNQDLSVLCDSISVEDIKQKTEAFLLPFLVRWARLELAQAYAHYPLKVACLPFHHHRLFDLGLQRYDKNLNLQIFLQLFLIFF